METLPVFVMFIMIIRCHLVLATTIIITASSTSCYAFHMYNNYIKYSTVLTKQCSAPIRHHENAGSAPFGKADRKWTCITFITGTKLN